MEQILALDPSEEVEFAVVAGGMTTAALKLSNISSQGLIFKVKTTSPGQVIVKPNHGFLRPGEDSTVTFTVKTAEAQATLAKLKFQIQAAPTTQTQISDIPAAFASLKESTVNRVLQARFFDRNGINTEPQATPKASVRPLSTPVAAAPTPSFSISTISTGLDLRKYRDQLLQEKAALEQRVQELESEVRRTRSENPKDIEEWQETSGKGYSVPYLGIVAVLGMLIGSAVVGR